MAADSLWHEKIIDPETWEVRNRKAYLECGAHTVAIMAGRHCVFVRGTMPKEEFLDAIAPRLAIDRARLPDYISYGQSEMPVLRQEGRQFTAEQTDFLLRPSLHDFIDSYLQIASRVGNRIMGPNYTVLRMLLGCVEAAGVRTRQELEPLTSHLKPWCRVTREFASGITSVAREFQQKIGDICRQLDDPTTPEQVIRILCRPVDPALVTCLTSTDCRLWHVTRSALCVTGLQDPDVWQAAFCNALAQHCPRFRPELVLAAMQYTQVGSVHVELQVQP